MMNMAQSPFAHRFSMGVKPPAPSFGSVICHTLRKGQILIVSETHESDSGQTFEQGARYEVAEKPTYDRTGPSVSATLRKISGDGPDSALYRTFKTNSTRYT